MAGHVAGVGAEIEAGSLPFFARPSGPITPEDAMNLIAMPTRPAAPPMTVEELEQMDDHAHTSSRARHLEIANHVPLTVDPRGMADRWRRRAEQHRNTARMLVGILRFLKLHPEAHTVRVGGCDWTEQSARKELAYQRDRHRQCCGQLGGWLPQAAALDSEPAMIVRPQLGFQIRQLGAQELSLVIDLWDAQHDVYIASVNEDDRALDTALIDRARAAFLLNDARRWLLVTPEAAKTWFTDALRRAQPLRLLAAE
ncbi:hypothetical protein [Azospirillum canadense]|uniref:hypothetical protein n=1 Tax=Azospirillum canadense TaxID=403962 RepID=UPI0022274944|nr:hypothetical protein [Azospirillum canadense]MCW2242764.1 hypothetical protein [Azospirillum canadense]